MTDHQLLALEAWSTLAAAVFAAGTVLFAINAWVRVRDRDKRKQASQIAAWIAEDPAPFDPAVSRAVLVRNASELPIYFVTPDVFLDGEHLARVAMIEVMAPGERLTSLGLSDDHIAGMGRKNLESMFVQSRFDMPVGLRFRDASGQWWKRHPAGRLEALKVPKRVS